MIGRATLGEARRYLMVGGVCAALHNILVISADQLGVYYMLALCLSFIVVNPIGYLLNSRYTFGTQLSWMRFVRFMGGLVVGSLISLVVMFVLCTLLKVPVFIATPITTILLLVWNYSSARWAVLMIRRSQG